MVLCHDKIANELEEIKYEYMPVVCSATTETTHMSSALVLGLLVVKTTAY